MAHADTHRGIQADPVRGADFDARIRIAELALTSLDIAVRALPHARELRDAALRREAVAAVGLDGWKVALSDLLLFEAASPLPQSRGLLLERAHDAVVRASRYLDALSHGHRRLEVEGTLTGDILLGVLAQLAGESCDPNAAIVTRAVAEIEAWLRSDGAQRSAVVRASVTRQRLARLQTAMEECGQLSRIAALLLLCASDQPFLSMISPSVRVLRDAKTPGVDAATLTEMTDGAAGSDQDEVAARFADGLVASADDAVSLVERIMALIDEDERRIGALSKAAHSARRVHLALQRWPVIALPRLLQETGLRVQAATSALHRLRALGIVREITGRYRHRVYSYDAYVTLLSHDLW